MSESSEESPKSILLTGYGGYDKIVVQNLPLSRKVGPDEVKIRNELFGVNFADLYTLKGLFEHPTPLVMGLESAGKVVEVGTSVQKIKVGDRVVCYKWSGELYSEVIIVHSNNCFVVPSNISDKDAVALPANYLTAYLALFKIAKLEADQSVLIHSCAGGVGWAATQLAKSLSNVTVFGTTSKEKFKAVAENGVEQPMTYEAYNSISQFIPGSKFDCIIDCLGGSNFGISQKLLKPLGKVVLTGCNSLIKGSEQFSSFERTALGSSTIVDAQELVMGSKSVSGIHLGLLMDQNPDLIRSSMEILFQFLIDGKIKPRVDSVHPFEKVVEAISSLEKRKNIGKVLLTL